MPSPREAYIYGEPIVDNYRIQHAYFVDRAGPEHKTSWIWNSSREIIFATFPGADAEVIGDRWLDDLGLEAPVSDLLAWEPGLRGGGDKEERSGEGVRAHGGDPPNLGACPATWAYDEVATTTTMIDRTEMTLGCPRSSLPMPPLLQALAARRLALPAHLSRPQSN